MTTESQLESMTDRSKFEKLATSVIRKSNPKYAGLIHLGVNSCDETVVGTVDGLHQISHSDPPHWIIVQHTTTDSNRLRGKWLTDQNSDLKKSITEANKIRQDQPGAIITVILTTNQRVSKKLYQDVIHYGGINGVGVEIWEQSSLASFLDNDAEGQWIRSSYLGIKAERLSARLLLDLGKQSLEDFRHTIIQPGQGSLINRSIVDEILKGARAGGPGLCLIAGQSGYGKSIAAFQALDQWLSGGRLGLWLPAHFLEKAVSLESALDAYLSSLYPTLEPGAGRVAMGLVSNSSRLLLCIDDINRTDDPIGHVQKMMNYATPPSSDMANGNGDRSSTLSSVLCQVVPVWHEHLSSFNRKTLNRPWVQTIYVGNMLPEESAKMIKAKLPGSSAVEINEYATQLNNDPFLLGLFTMLVDENMDSQKIGSLADDAIKHYISNQIRSINKNQGVNLLKDEVVEGMIETARLMIIHRNLNPSISELRHWVDDTSREMRSIRCLIDYTKVCEQDDESRLIFRHDRIREWFLVKAMIGLLKLDAPPIDIIEDPYYYAVVGKAIACTELPLDRLALLRSIAPLALFESVRHVGEASNQYHSRLFLEAIAWATNESQTSPDSTLSAICWTLVGTDSGQMFKIIDALKPNRLLMIAALRNGSIYHGMRYIRCEFPDDFEPGYGDGLRDRMIEHAVHHHGEHMANQLREQLSRHDIDALDAKSCLALLGHCRFGGFGKLIQDVLAKHQDKVLWHALWAAARCPLEDTGALVRQIVDRIKLIPPWKDGTNDPTDGLYNSQYIGWGLGRGISGEAIHSILQCARQDSSLGLYVSLMVEGIDHPDTAEFIVRSRASGVIYNRLLCGIGDGDPAINLLSCQTANRLRSLWESHCESDSVRKIAFCMWLQATGGYDTKFLATIRPDTPYYRLAIQHRIKMSDFSVVPELLHLLRSSDMGGWWWNLAHRVWCYDIMCHVSGILGGFHGKIPPDFTGGNPDRLWYFSELIAKIPTADAEILLRDNWSHLKFSPRMIVSALRVATPVCENLVGEAMAQCPTHIDIFHGAFLDYWRQSRLDNPIAMRHLKCLEPYLDRINIKDILYLAWSLEKSNAMNDDIAEWIRNNLVPRLDMVDRCRVSVSLESFISHLDRAFGNTQHQPILSYLFSERKGSPFINSVRQISILDAWLSSHRTIRGLQVVAECLKYIGSRSDLATLKRYSIDGDKSSIDLIVADAQFAIYKRTLI